MLLLYEIPITMLIATYNLKWNQNQGEPTIKKLANKIFRKLLKINKSIKKKI